MKEGLGKEEKGERMKWRVKGSPRRKGAKGGREFCRCLEAINDFAFEKVERQC